MIPYDVFGAPRAHSDTSCGGFSKDPKLRLVEISPAHHWLFIYRTGNMTLIVKHGNTFKFLREETTNLLIWGIFKWSMIILFNVFFKKSINVVNVGLIKVQRTNGWKIASIYLGISFYHTVLKCWVILLYLRHLSPNHRPLS